MVRMVGVVDRVMPGKGKWALVKLSNGLAVGGFCFGTVKFDDQVQIEYDVKEWQGREVYSATSCVVVTPAGVPGSLPVRGEPPALAQASSASAPVWSGAVNYDAVVNMVREEAVIMALAVKAMEAAFGARVVPADVMQDYATSIYIQAHKQEWSARTTPRNGF